MDKFEINASNTSNSGRTWMLQNELVNNKEKSEYVKCI